MPIMPTPFQPLPGSVNSLNNPQLQSNTSDFNDAINMISQKMAQLYQPQNTAQSAYTSQLANIPQRQDFQPSRLRQIGAVLAGLGSGVGPLGIAHGSPIGIRTNPQEAMQVSSNVANQPYNQALQDW